MVHDVTVHVTNSNARVAVCTCGWVGIVHPLRKYKDHAKNKWRYDAAAAEGAARDEWTVHNKMAHVPLVPPDLRGAVRTVTHCGRWGHP